MQSLKQSAATLSIENKNSENIEQNTQWLFLSCKTYNLIAPGTGFIIELTFVGIEGTLKGPSSYS